jgi:hypothetical protein
LAVDNSYLHHHAIDFIFLKPVLEVSFAMFRK